MNLEDKNNIVANFMQLNATEFGLYYLPQYLKYVPILYSHEFDKKDCYRTKELEYCISWDWLIPVINKIYSLDAYSVYKSEISNIVDGGGLKINTSNIAETFNRTIDFIVWYNKQNKL